MDTFWEYTQKDDSVNCAHSETLAEVSFLEATGWEAEQIASVRDLVRFGSKPFNSHRIQNWPAAVRQKFERARARMRKAKQRCADASDAIAEMEAARAEAQQLWLSATETAARLKASEKRWGTFIGLPASDRPAGTDAEIAQEIWEAPLPLAPNERMERRAHRKKLSQLAASDQVVGEQRIYCKNSPTISARAGERLILDRRIESGRWSTVDLNAAIATDIEATRPSRMPFAKNEPITLDAAQHDEGAASAREKRSAKWIGKAPSNFSTLEEAWAQWGGQARGFGAQFDDEDLPSLPTQEGKIERPCDRYTPSLRPSAPRIVSSRVELGTAKPLEKELRIAPPKPDRNSVQRSPEVRAMPRTEYRTREQVDALFSETEREGFIQWFNRNRHSRRKST